MANPVYIFDPTGLPQPANFFDLFELMESLYRPPLVRERTPAAESPALQAFADLIVKALPTAKQLQASPRMAGFRSSAGDTVWSHAGPHGELALCIDRPVWAMEVRWADDSLPLEGIAHVLVQAAHQCGVALASEEIGLGVWPGGVLLPPYDVLLPHHPDWLKPPKIPRAPKPEGPWAAPGVYSCSGAMQALRDWAEPHLSAAGFRFHHLEREVSGRSIYLTTSYVRDTPEGWQGIKLEASYFKIRSGDFIQCDFVTRGVFNKIRSVLVDFRRAHPEQPYGFLDFKSGQYNNHCWVRAGYYWPEIGEKQQSYDLRDPERLQACVDDMLGPVWLNQVLPWMDAVRDLKFMVDHHWLVSDLTRNLMDLSSLIVSLWLMRHPAYALWANHENPPQNLNEERRLLVRDLDAYLRAHVQPWDEAPGG